MSLAKTYSVFVQILDINNEKYKHCILCKFGVEAFLHDFRAWVRNSRQMKIRRHLKY